ncbi:putative membrane protein insertion efficiency factor [Malonomonas rubra DSM 5091]|uniref:Putative membrane protein insertion efficiency factor n=1 Tax=Malonomonas rubra DSM 5091 TaxID=1122189 RepID=A0A1M6C0H9_MALRU|nr:membrane protein insertion efficiency factor YidD [Malonomonas rubra]SHI54549.1 putative membrane protein insertion efficiency factor [Malonomonas rubra DSM 5091]
MTKTFIIILMLLIAAPACAENWGPWEAPKQKRSTSTPQANPLEVAIKLFQKHISSVDGPRCPMYPTCSGYGLQAVKRHGPLLGTFLLVDRLFREQDSELISQRKIVKYGYIRFFDPVDDNDFWLQRMSKENPHPENR